MLTTTVTKSPDYICNGATVDFNTGFEFQSNSELFVLVVNDATGVVSEPPWTATGANNPGGGVVNASGAMGPIESGNTLTIYRRTPRTQPYRMANFNVANFENALDNLAQQIQELYATVAASGAASLTNQAFEHKTTGTATATSGFRVTPNGVIEERRGGDWVSILNIGVLFGDKSAFRARYALGTSAPGGTFTGTTGVFIETSASPSWVLENSSVGINRSRTGVLTLQNKLTGYEVSATFSMLAGCGTGT